MASAALTIRLFGELDLRLDGTPLPALESARARSLLAFLILHRDTPQPRQRLAFLLWPDSTEAQARTNLRHVLHHLRQVLPGLTNHLEITPGTLRWRGGSDLQLDIARFEDLLARRRAGADDAVTLLSAAVELYRGDLLESCYDEWITPERERLRQAHLDALECLAELLEDRGEAARSIEYAQRLLRHDPLREGGYRLLMRLHAARGDRAQALRVYHACEATLDRELGVDPAADTRAAYESLLSVEPKVGAGGVEAGRAGDAPLVGRQSEWERLVALWRETERGRAQLVLLTGEAGIGKTRLTEELRRWCAHRGAVTAEARSYRAEGALAYAPVTAWLRSEAFGERVLQLDRSSLSEISRLLPELLVEVPGLAAPDTLPESEQRPRLFAALARAILAAGGPLLLLADDLHWCDRETLQFLHYLLRVQPEARVLVAGTARREEIDGADPLRDLVSGLQALDRCTEIDLARLNRAETTVLAERLTGRRLEEADADQLFAETEGNPLFVSEALRAGWKGGQGPSPSSPRVQGVIRSRLSVLSEPARELAALAATIGREFTTDVLEEASGAGGESVVRGLDELWRRLIIREHGARGYDFSHDRIREIAYLELSPAVRTHHHLAVARALERVHVRDTGPVSAQIASHYERAGLTVEAIGWLEAAAEEARRLYANRDTIRLLEHALDLLERLPASVEGESRELAIRTALLTPLASVEGFASSRLAEVQRRSLASAHALRVDPPPQLLYSLAFAALCRDDFEEARRSAEELRARGRTDADEALLVESEYLLGISAFWKGELGAARRHFEAAVAGYRDSRQTPPSRYWVDPRVVCQSRLGNTLWFLGDPAAAIRAREEALALADEVGHPPSRATTLVFAALLAVEMDDAAAVREYVRALDASPGEYAARPNRAASEVLGAYLRVLDGAIEPGLAVLRSALEDSQRAEHAPGLRATVTRLLLAACTAARDPVGILDAAERLLGMGGAGRLWESEAHRVRAECLAQLGGPAAEVETALTAAREVARRQGARMLEQKALASPAQRRSRDPAATLLVPGP